jgi:ribonuclease J
MTDQTLEVIPLGGLGEFGMHMMAFRCSGSIIVVDAGVMFPDDELLGVDVIVPDIGFLLEHKSEVLGIVLTHGHEDHIGALPFILPYLDVPVYASSFTMGLVRNKLEQHGLLDKAQLHTVRPKTWWTRTIQGGVLSRHPFHRRLLCVGHSVSGRPVIHTGDFKIDPTPI